MKIVILTDDIVSGGGAGVVAWNHAKALRTRGWEVCVITTSRNDLQETSEKEGISIYTISSGYHPILRAYKSLNNRPVVKKVGEILAEIKPDVVHAHNIHSHISYAALAEAKRHTPAIFITIHDSMPFHYSKLFPVTVDVDGREVKSYKVSSLRQLQNFKWQYNPFRNRIIKKYLKIPTKIFAVSGALVRALADNGIKNVEVIHNGIDVKEWEQGGSDASESNNTIFFGGRLSGAKGGDVLVEAMKKIVEKNVEAKLLVVGEENEYSKNLAEKIGKDHIVFTGFQTRENMKSMYARASVVAVPSLCFDWFPTVILEAMACGKPVIATCFGGSMEMVEEGKTGFIINPQNSGELAEKIEFFLAHPEKAQEMGSAGHERVLKEFSIEKHIQTLVAWYDKTLKK